MRDSEDKKEEVKFNVELIKENSPVIGKSVVVILLPEVKNANEYTVTVKGQKAKFLNNKFVVTLDGSYTEKDLTNEIVKVAKVNK